MSGGGRGTRGTPSLLPLSKQEIDRRIEQVLADLGAEVEEAGPACASSPDPLRPRLVRAATFAQRMRRLAADN